MACRIRCGLCRSASLGVVHLEGPSPASAILRDGLNNNDIGAKGRGRRSDGELKVVAAGMFGPLQQRIPLLGGIGIWPFQVTVALLWETVPSTN